MHTVKPCYSLQVLFLAACYLGENSTLPLSEFYTVYEIALDMAIWQQIGLKNLQKFDYDQITIIVITHKKAPMIMIT